MEKGVKIIFISFEIIFGAFLTWREIIHLPDGRMHAVFFNIGQGDSTLMTTPRGKHILIDGGPDKTALYKLGEYFGPGEKVIDAVILSHPHSDHLTGILEVFKRYTVKKIFLPKSTIDTPEYSKLLEFLASKSSDVYFVDSKFTYDIDGMKLNFLHPEGSASEKNINNQSVLVLAAYGKNRILFTGDLEKEGQDKNLEEDVASDILKAPHQGSSDSLNEAFLKKASPKFAVISVGENNYGHPSLRVIKSYERQGIATLITQERGDIHFSGDGEVFEFHKL